MLAIFLLVAVYAALVVRTWAGQRKIRRFVSVTQSGLRARTFLLWTIENFLWFAVGGSVVLGALGRLDAAGLLPAEFAALHQRLDLDARGWALAAAGTVGFVAAIALIRAGVRRFGLGRTAAGEARARRPVVSEEVASLLPRNGVEAAAASVLAVVTGVTEEFFFRFALPLLICIVTGSALAGFVAAAITFGVIHGSERWKGFLATLAILLK